MTRYRSIIMAGVGAVALAFATSVYAQEVLPYAPDGPYSQLSPGQQKIVDALYDNQTPTDTGETDPVTGDPILATMDKDQLTELKNDTGWGQVFHGLKADGQFEDFKNLGQLISSTRPDRPEHPEHPEHPDHPDTPHNPHND